MVGYINIYSCGTFEQPVMHSEKEALEDIEEKMHTFRNDLNFFYVETVITSHDGQTKHARVTDYRQELEERACLRDIENGESEDCGCGHHEVIKAQTDVGINSDYWG